MNNLFGTEFVVKDWFAVVGNQLTGSQAFSIDSICLPVGISFFIVQAISYVVDVSRRTVAPIRNFWEFGFYRSFFPQRVAGPIVRAKEFFPQLHKPFFLGRRYVYKRQVSDPYLTTEEFEALEFLYAYMPLADLRCV